MSFSKSVLAYPDIKGYFEQAIESERGIRIICKDPKSATMYKHRMNYFRVLHRKDNAQLYPQDHSMHGRSPYDVLIIRQRDHEILVEKLALNPHSTELL